MKNIFIAFVSMISIVFLLAALLGIRHIQGTNCYSFAMPNHVQVFSESDSATNIVAEFQPDDVIIFCGENQ